MKCVLLTSLIISFSFFTTATKATNKIGIIKKLPSSGINKSTEENISMRHGKTFRLESQFFNTKPQVHIIKVPSHVSKVKLIGPHSEQISKSILQLKRSPVAKQGINRKSQTYENYDYFTKNPTNFNPKKVIRNLKKQQVKELGFKDYYSEENFPYNQNIFDERLLQAKTFENSRKVLKSKKKNLSEAYNSHIKQNEADTPLKINYQDYKKEGDEEHDFEPAATTFQGQRNTPKKLQKIKTTSPDKMMKPNYLKEKPTLSKYSKNYFPEIDSKNQYSKREPFFHQHYTSHNPHVVTNFGLPFTNNNQQHLGKVPINNAYEKLGQQIMAGSEQVFNSVPISNPGIKVIQPPQFRNFSRPTHSSRPLNSTQQNTEATPNQKATITDILEQDCPNYETIGFCESPPRYPMHQIKNILKKCAIIVEAMNTQNFEDQKTVLGFSKRFGFAVETQNRTTASEPETERVISQKKILNDGGAACHSEIFLTEPGYAREVISGKWFVVVQDPDVLQQKIVTDTCTNTGKPCEGLIHLKCNRLSGNEFKFTSCIQRFSYQKLMSWDPDSPDSCPKLRVFKFPSACICHLGPF